MYKILIWDVFWSSSTEDNKNYVLCRTVLTEAGLNNACALTEQTAMDPRVLEEQASVEQYGGVIRHNKHLDFTDDMNELAAVQSHQDAVTHGEKIVSTDDLNEQTAAQNFQDIRENELSIRCEKVLELEEKAAAQNYYNSLLQEQIIEMKQKCTNNWIKVKIEEGIKEREDAIQAQVTEELLSKDPDAIKKQRITEANKYTKAKKKELHTADERFQKVGMQGHEHSGAKRAMARPYFSGSKGNCRWTAPAAIQGISSLYNSHFPPAYSGGHYILPTPALERLVTATTSESLDRCSPNISSRTTRTKFRKTI
ncbi:hypothetical protein K440DRAFT_641743 [Wilcoxina mikolae CBS 423.85]|nr:hypothetical protein K440DRAFT_641743 [Wilcoxina mikolae CBS 423.85]